MVWIHVENRKLIILSNLKIKKMFILLTLELTKVMGEKCDDWITILCWAIDKWCPPNFGQTLSSDLSSSLFFKQAALGLRFLSVKTLIILNNFKIFIYNL